MVATDPRFSREDYPFFRYPSNTSDSYTGVYYTTNPIATGLSRINYIITKLYKIPIWKLKKKLKECNKQTDKISFALLKMVYLARCKKPEMIIINQNPDKIYINKQIKPYIRNSLRSTKQNR